MATFIASLGTLSPLSHKETAIEDTPSASPTSSRVLEPLKVFSL